MANKTTFFCNECGYETSKWLGKCPGCGAWSSFTEEKIQKEKNKRYSTVVSNTKPVKIKEITAGDLFDWGKECAIVSRPIHKYREGAVIDNREYSRKYGELAEHQVRNAGYRLAKLLNDIFK